MEPGVLDSEDEPGEETERESRLRESHDAGLLAAARPLMRSTAAAPALSARLA